MTSSTAIDPTPIDMAFAAMEATGSDADRLRFYERVADAELFLLVEEEPVGDDVNPQLFDLEEEGRVVVAFDRAERLAAFVGGPSPFVALSGRALVRLLAEEKLGLGLNLEVAPSSYLLPADAVAWLADTLTHAPDAADLKVDEVTAPGELPERLLTALDAKLALMGAAAETAFLAMAAYEDGSRGHILAFVDAAPGAEGALSQAASEALTFSGLEAGQLDVTFIRATDAVAGQLARVALRFDLPKTRAEAVAPEAPGTDPAKPPKLR
ncbi:MAG: SseB family protein [Pseudomonadota bacterium]